MLRREWGVRIVNALDAQQTLSLFVVASMTGHEPTAYLIGGIARTARAMADQGSQRTEHR